MLRSTYRLLLFAACSTFWAFRFSLRDWFVGIDHSYARRHKMRVTARVLRIFGIRLQVHGAVPEEGTYLVVANHRSAFDIAVLMSVLGGAFLSRADLKHWPIAGRLAILAETIFVERGNQRSGANAIRAIRRRLKSGGTALVFPEGTTLAGDEVRPFRRGAFAALSENAKVLPVGLAYPPGTEFTQPSFVEHIKAIARRPSTEVHMVIGEATVALGKPAEIATHYCAEVQQLTLDARTEADR